MMKCLSIRQPWAWAILHAGKRIENRGWITHYRGPMLIHAAKGMTTSEFVEAFDWMDLMGCHPIEKTPYMNGLPVGAIVGVCDLVDVIYRTDPRAQKDPWFTGPYGFVLDNVRSFAEPIPYRGQLNLFEVPDDVVSLTIP